MKNTHSISSNFAPNAESKILNLTAAANDAAPGLSFATAVKRASEVIDTRPSEGTDRIEPLIGDSDPHSTPFGVKHFWYKA